MQIDAIKGSGSFDFFRVVAVVAMVCCDGLL